MHSSITFIMHEMCEEKDTSGVQAYRKASFRGAHGHDPPPPKALLKGIGPTPQQQTLQRHYLYYR